MESCWLFNNSNIETSKKLENEVINDEYSFSLGLQ